MENNATMTKENQDIITGIMGVEPIYINSNLLTAQERKRLYWTNIPDIKQPEDKGIFLRDIVQPREEKKEYECYKRMMAKKEGTLAHKKAWSQVKTLDQKSRALTTAQNISNSGATNIKYSDTEYYILTPLECERLQTLPDNYTEGVAGDVSGTVQGVTHIQTDEAAAAGEAGNDRTALTLSKAVKAGCKVIALERTDTVAGMTTDDIAALKGVLKQYE